MQIAYDFADRGDPEDAELWRGYCDAMFGARMLTWSRGLRERLGLGEEATDEELAESIDASFEVVQLIHGQEWDRLRDSRGARARILELVERRHTRSGHGLCAAGGRSMLSTAPWSTDGQDSLATQR
jgi:hypothetical protein